MRILAYSQEKIKLNIDKSLTNFIFMDYSSDIDEVEYASFIRRYELIYVHIKEGENLKSFMELFKNLNNSDDFSFKLNLIFESEELLIKFKQSIKSLYKNLNPKYLMTNTNISPFISKEVINTFNNTPEIIKSLNIDLKNKSISIDLGEGLMTIDMSASNQKKSFQLLLFFIRHYGEVINMSTILSATNKEPELASFSPIEGAISNLREVFFNLFSYPTSIKSVKKVGYVFNLKTV